MTDFASGFPPNFYPDPDEHRSQIVRYLQTLRESLKVIEALAFTRDFEINIRNNQNHELTRPGFYGQIRRVQYNSVDDSNVTVDLRINTTSVITDPASPYAVIGGGWYTLDCVGDRDFDPGDDINVRTTSGSNNDSLKVILTIENPRLQA